ncbi:MAG TPA: winged helix DNA-binding protein [Microvirga sp.]|jgi:DNA-binding MarR family transcriptional regulator|nr:winged helix DNA-binding protein [Microvirga sp.]
MNTIVPAEAIGASAPLAYDPTVKTRYLQAVHRMERLHRRLLDMIKEELDRSGRSELTGVQALLLYNIADQELSAGDLRRRGYYLGSNVSYTVKKLGEAGYLHCARSDLDRRSVRIRLTESGREIHAMIQSLYDGHAQSIEVMGGLALPDIDVLNRMLVRLDRFWTQQSKYRQ